MDKKLKNNIETVLNLFVRPHLFTHGGNIKIIDLDEHGTLWIEMQGKCAGCPSADDTTKSLVEKELRYRIPQIKEVKIDSGISDEILAEAMHLFTYHFENRDTVK